MKKYTPFIFVLLISFLTWWRLSNLTLRGDSLIYFIQSYHEKYLNNDFHLKLANFDWAALLIGKGLESVFGTHLSPYGWFEVLVLVSTVGLFYWMVFVITKKTILAFSASLIFGVSYYGNWDMYIGDVYLVFLERVPPMLFLIPSFAFLHLFLEQKIKKYYIYSLSLFFLGVGIAHWGAFFTTIYCVYPIFWNLYNDKKKKLLISGLLGAAYGGISLFFVIIQNILHPGLVPNWSLTEFIFNPHLYEYPVNIFKQLTYWSTYLPFVNIIAKNGFDVSPITTFVQAETSLVYMPHILIVYVITFVVTYLKLPNYRAILVSIWIALISLFFFNAYFGQYHIASQPGSNRYLYLPTYLLAIYWSLFIFSIFWKKTGKRYLFGIILLVGFVFTNYWLVSEHFTWIEDLQIRTKKVWYAAVDLGHSVPEGSYIITPHNYTGLYETEFLNDQFQKRKVTFIDDSENWQKKVVGSKDIYMLDYFDSCKCIQFNKWQKQK